MIWQIIFALVAILLVSIAVALSSKPRKRLNIEFPEKSRKEWTGKVVEKQSINVECDPHSIQCYDPSTGFDLGIVPVVFPDTVESLVQRARVAQNQWQQEPFEKRRLVLSSMLDWIVENQEKICQVCARDSGKTIVDGSLGEILTTCEKLRWTIENGEKYLMPEYRAPGLILSMKYPRVEYVPVGVMGCIVSWNYPFHNVFGPIISSLMAGNACIVKCSEHVAWSTGFWQSVFTQLLSLYNIDPNLVILMNGYAETGQKLISLVDKLTFIGSPQVGKSVMKSASETLTPVVLELGGKDCAIVFDDCDFNQFTSCCCRLVFQNAGQNCAGLERIIIQQGIHDQFVDTVTKIVKEFRVGPPLLENVDIGAITMRKQLVDDAVAKGAKVMTGGKRFEHPKYPMGQFYEPTIITNVTLDMKISKQEIFGPVMLIYKFKTEQDAIDIANSTSFGLGSGVYSLDYEKANRVCQKLKVGMTNVNDFAVNYLCQGLPFGGVGISGVDCFSGVEGLRGQCTPRAVTSDRIPGVRTKLPAAVAYPLKEKAFKFQEGLVTFLYGRDLKARMQGLYELVTNL